jgi:uncharacterized membrane protein YqaE (UPF0057 family)
MAVDGMLIAKYVSAVLLPPLAVFLQTGISTQFWLGELESSFFGVVACERGRKKSPRSSLFLSPHSFSLSLLSSVQKKTQTDLLLTFLVWVPGIIYALYIIVTSNRGALTGGVV